MDLYQTKLDYIVAIFLAAEVIVYSYDRGWANNCFIKVWFLYLYKHVGSI